MLKNFFATLGVSQGTLDSVPSSLPDAVASPAASQSDLVFKTTGRLETITTSGGTDDIGAWLISGGAGAFDINVTVNSGTLDRGAGGTFNLGTERTFGIDRASVGTKTTSVTFKLRRAGSSTDVDTQTVTFTAQVT